jgi:hypothetical protein
MAVLADVDGDGRAELLVSSGSAPGFVCSVGDEPAGGGGVRVFDVPGTPWTKTRRVWNEELYRVTNVEDDGSIPASPKVNWKEPGLNGFRTNLQIPVERTAPDLRAEVTTDCAAEKFRATARIGNAGQALAPAGVVVEFYEGTPEEGQLLGTAQTTVILGPGQVEDVMLELGTVPDGFEDGSTKLTVRVVTDALLLPQGECNIENNLAILEEACKK